MTREDPGLLVYVVVLWLAVFGMMAFRASHPVTRWSKALGALTFVLLLVDANRAGY